MKTNLEKELTQKVNLLRFSKSEEAQLALKQFKRRMTVANRSPQTIRNYFRAVEFLMDFHNTLAVNIEIDQIIDFLYHLSDVKQVNWRTQKIYVAGLRWYYQEVLQEVDFAHQIPYPKEEKTLPVTLSREELTTIFNCCKNDKHRVIFRLMYSSGLRRNELLNLIPDDIDTKDGKRRIHVRNAKGKNERYTVLSEKVLNELRVYFKSYFPKNYLFNGRRKGEKMSKEGIRDALKKAVKGSGIKKNITLHIFRHCFASHALEEGMDIKTLQYLLGHSSVRTTMIYLHVSEVPLNRAFSPLDKWEK